MISTFEKFSFKTARDKEVAGSRDSVNLPDKNYDRSGNEVTIELNPDFIIEEETTSPHPLEIAEASAEKSKVVTSPFTLSIVNTEENDTLEKIADRYKIDIELLKKINNEEERPFTKDEKVTIFKGNFTKHTVKTGQSIWSIANEHNVKMSVIIFLNKLKAVRIFPDEELFIPDDIDDSSTNLACSVKWVRKLVDPPYQSLLGSKGRITSPFGWRTHPVTGKKSFHVGIDIGAPKSTTIKAWKDGVIEKSGTLELLGKYIVIRHDNGYSSVYGHCSVLSLKVGDKVKAGAKIAEVGRTGRATGSHLHFAIKKDGRFLNPINHLGS
jgi:murein DD-endopeptidase MepM/ murein hydrolase activator NlpD